jgi:hypothetical protein
MLQTLAMGKAASFECLGKLGGGSLDQSQRWVLRQKFIKAEFLFKW